MAALLRRNIDTVGGGTITGASTENVFGNGYRFAQLGDPVSDHGDDAHGYATMTGASSTVFVNNVRVCRVNDSASCGHVGTGGSANIFIG